MHTLHRSRRTLSRRLDQGPFTCGECPGGYAYTSAQSTMEFLSATSRPGVEGIFDSRSSCVDIGPRARLPRVMLATASRRD